jgi:hypothetical protein
MRISALQAELEPTPPKKPAESAALNGHAAAAHCASVTFYGSHRVFLGPPPSGDGLSTPHLPHSWRAFPPWDLWITRCMPYFCIVWFLQYSSLAPQTESLQRHMFTFGPQKSLSLLSSIKPLETWESRGMQVVRWHCRSSLGRQSVCQAPALWQRRPGAPSQTASGVCVLTWR